MKTRSTRSMDGRPAGARVESLEARRHLSAASAAGDLSVVMSGLDNPRGLNFGPQGALYVAEAGRGGDGPSVVQRGSVFSYGATGAVSRLLNGHQERVVTGLPSLAMAGGLRAEGASDVSLHGVGNAYVTIGLEGNPNLRDQLGDVGSGFGRLDRFSPNGHWSAGAQLASYEASANPDGRQLDTDPYGLLAEAGGQVVVDAGGNSLLRVAPNGEISTIAVLPTLPLSQVVSGDPVPTCVAAGPDGAYYVGILSGAPFRDGLARIYRVVPGEAPTEFRTGFKTIVDIDFDPQGDLYVLQHSSGATGVAGPGSLLRLTPDGTRSTVLGGLSQPTSVAVGPDGALYVTEFGTSPDIGRVLRLELANPIPLVAPSPAATALVSLTETRETRDVLGEANDSILRA